jgi:hypothetical protein
MWETIILTLIIAACAFFIGRRFYRQFTGKQTGCGGGCGGCGKSATSDDCSSKADFPEKNKP